MKIFKSTFLFVLFFNTSFAQVDSIFNQGVYRNYILHLPAGYTSTNSYPLILNFHGLNSNAFEQEAYTQFDAVADTGNFVVVYPNGISGAWDVAGNRDVDFVLALVDSLRENYAISNCLFSTGMSDGGFMTYRLACSIPSRLTAVAVVAGNMPTIFQSTCALDEAVPVMHIHGTADAVVSYNGVPGLPPVETTVQWWADHDSCTSLQGFSSFPNLVPGDSCTADATYNFNTTTNDQVALIRINNGGHTWPGGLIPIPSLGNTNLDISASGLIWSFFRQYCTANMSVNELNSEFKIDMYPNPSFGYVHLDLNSLQLGEKEITVFNFLGQPVKNMMVEDSKSILDLTEFNPGIYLIQVCYNRSIYTGKKLLLIDQ